MAPYPVTCPVKSEDFGVECRVRRGPPRRLYAQKGATMPANRSTSYSSTKQYDIEEQVRLCWAKSGHPRIATHLEAGNTDAARKAWAEASVTEFEWRRLMHPALVASTEHPESTETIPTQLINGLEAVFYDSPANPHHPGHSE